MAKNQHKVARLMSRKLKTKDWFHADGFPIAIERREPQEPYDLHAHEFSEVVIITGGKGLHVTGEESWPLIAGDVFVISGSRAHGYRDLDNLRLVNILYQPDPLNLDLRDLASLPGYHALFSLEPVWRKRHQFESRLHLSPQELGLVLGLADQIEEELKARKPGFGFVTSALFMQLIARLSRDYSRSQNSNSRALLRIAEAITHLETHSEQPVNLETLTSIAHMPKRSFIRAFQAATGISPIAYLIQLRVNRAAVLLRQSEDSITDIAFRVGFSDSNYFARQFRKQLCVSPRDYRRQHRRME